MGKHGPKRTPTAILKMRGSPNVSRRKNEAVPVAGPLDCPTALAADPVAKSFWDRFIPLLIGQGTASPIDAPSLEQMARDWSSYQRFTEYAECVDPGTTEWTRLRNQANACEANLLRWSQRFGMTPADRAGLRVEKQASADDELAKKLRIGG